MLDVDAEVDRRDFAVRATLRVGGGERLALFGPSGAGKTTLLETIAGLVVPRRAVITLGGRLLTSTEPPVTRVPPWRRRVGLLRQDPALFPHLPVRANLRYGYAAARPPADLEEIAAELGIGGLLSAMPARLSGGQAHRVALGRLLLARCDALLLDEPYSGLDASLRRQLTDLVIRLVTERAVPAVLVAHELAEAQAFATRLAVLDRGEILHEGGTGEVVLRPASRRVAELVGYGGFVPVRPDCGGGRRAAAPGWGTANDPAPATRETGAGRPAAGTAVAGIHPDRVLAGAHPDRGVVLSCVVRELRPAGAGWEASMQAGGGLVTVRLPDKPPATGGHITVTALDPPVFGPDGAALHPSAPAPEQVGS